MTLTGAINYAPVGKGRPNWLRTNYALGSNPSRSTSDEDNVNSNNHYFRK